MNKALQNYECEGQLSIFQMGDKPQRFHESEWLKAQGFKNIYDEQPPEAGLYEFTDIEYPTKIKRFEVTENGGIMFGSSDFKARWWRPILQKEPEPKTGHRACKDLFGNGYCSECNKFLNYSDNYCPNCGAKMESEAKR